MSNAFLHRTASFRLHDPDARAVLIARWDLPSASARERAAEASLSAMPAATGLLRYSLFAEIEGNALFHLSQWRSRDNLGAYVDEGYAGPKAAVDAASPEISRAWRFLGEPVQAHVVTDAHPGCVVIVRQPTTAPDQAASKSWVKTVIAALRSDGGTPEGLFGANFFSAYDGSAAINLAGWKSADAHKAALQPADFNPIGSFGLSNAWRRTRSHPGISPIHEVTRCTFYGSVEP